MSFITKILVELSFNDIINLFVLNKNELRPIIYHNLPGLVNKDGIDLFVNHLIIMSEKELLKKTINQLYQLEHDIMHYVDVLKRDQVMFISILPMYELDQLLDNVFKITKDDQFMIQFTIYSMNYCLVNYLKTIVKMKTKNVELKNLMIEAQIMIDLSI